MSNEQILLPVIIFAISAVAGIIALGLSMALISRDMQALRKKSIATWKGLGLHFYIGPAQANFLNMQRSLGVGGNGTLVLTNDALRFSQLSPRREIVIPLNDIADVSLEKRFNGRWGGGPFLIIKRNVGDLTGFQVPNVVAWAEMVAKYRTGTAAPSITAIPNSAAQVAA